MAASELELPEQWNQSASHLVRNHGQSPGQLAGVSPVSQNASPQTGVHVQSCGQIRQFSSAALHTPSPQRDAAGFTVHCLTCHKTEDCGMFPTAGTKIAVGCIDCHMPVQESNAIVTASNGKRIKARVRSHWIKVYSDAGISN